MIHLHYFGVTEPERPNQAEHLVIDGVLSVWKGLYEFVPGAKGTASPFLTTSPFSSQYF